jgi:hypothetical protein
MEYSHYAAKAAYQRHTQHGGGKSKKSLLIQTFQHWYRIIQHRFVEEEKKSQNLPDTDVLLEKEALIQKHRLASINSSAKAHSELWRHKCLRKGSKWVPQESEVSNEEGGNFNGADLEVGEV